jgi:hypothetical protein
MQRAAQASFKILDEVCRAQRPTGTRVQVKPVSDALGVGVWVGQVLLPGRDQVEQRADANKGVVLTAEMGAGS